MKPFLTLSSLLVAVLGCGWLLLPEAMLGRWGVQTDTVGLFLGRRYGAMLLGYAVILWLGRAVGPSSGRTAILAGGAFVTCFIALVSAGGVLAGTVGSGAWITAGVEALLACGFLYFLVAGRGGPGSEAGS